MREIQLQEIELTSYPCSRNEYESDHAFNIEKLRFQKRFIHLYHMLMHIFLFSIFESVFFWFYITKQEEIAFRRHFEDLTMISNLICINVNIDLEPLYDYIENEHDNYNNQVPIRFTYILNGSLFSFIIILNMILYWQNYNLYKINKGILKQDSILLIGLFLYEYLFFQNIIYTYKPSAVMNIKMLLFTECLK